MPNYELTPEGMTTGDSAIAMMFLLKSAFVNYKNRTYSAILTKAHGYGFTLFSDICDPHDIIADEITIPYAALKSAIAPVEGEAFVEIGFGDVATDGLILYGPNDTMSKPDIEKRLNWRVINICQDYGDLRELLAAIER